MVRRWAIAGLVSPKCNVSQQRNDNGKGKKKKEFVNEERVIKTGSLTKESSSSVHLSSWMF